MAKAAKPKSDAKPAKPKAATKTKTGDRTPRIASGGMAKEARKAAAKYDTALFGTLVDDHNRHRALLAEIDATTGASDDRAALFTAFTREVKAHAAAEDQALWSSILRKPETTHDARHAIAEHKELEDMLDDLATRDMASPGWLTRFRTLKDEYLHHIKEEEDEQFPAAQTQLDAKDEKWMAGVFKARKKAEKAKAKVTPKKMKDD